MCARDRSVASMSWAACRLLLSSPPAFVQRLRETDPFFTPEENLEILQVAPNAGLSPMCV